jgi:hypothetical protein
MSRLLGMAGIVSAVLLAPVSAQLGPQPCPIVDAALPIIDGYTTIADINSDQRFELDRIADGGIPNPPYNFIICPGTTLDASLGPLTPLLDGFSLRCGTTLELGFFNCGFFEGADQVLIEDSTVPGYNIFTIEIIGFIFQNFTNSALTANGETPNVLMENVFFAVSPCRKESLVKRR